MGDIATDVFKKYFTIGNTILLLGILITQVRWQTQVDNRLQILELHVIDKAVHQPFEDKIQVFVPRVEIDARLRNIESSLQEIESDIKKNFNN